MPKNPDSHERFGLFWVKLRAVGVSKLIAVYCLLV